MLIGERVTDPTPAGDIAPDACNDTEVFEAASSMHTCPYLLGGEFELAWFHTKVIHATFDIEIAECAWIRRFCHLIIDYGFENFECTWSWHMLDVLPIR
jgi:hypothetical protein